MREGIIQPKFAEKFFRIDFESSPMPVLSLYPIPESTSLQGLRIEVAGLEQHPRFIPWSSLSSLPRVKLKVPLICQIFNWSEVVEWEGVRLADLLDHLKVETHPEGYYAIYSRDGIYFETLSRDEARDPGVLLAFGLNGAPLPEAHGGPLRLVVPFLQGYKSVKWVGAIRAFRYDPMGIKRLLGQSPSGWLNDAWRAKYDIALPKGRPGDPPLIGVSAPLSSTDHPVHEMIQATLGAIGAGAGSIRRQGTLKEIVAILRPGKKLETRQVLESIGVFPYTTYPVLGRSRQRGLKFSAGNEVAIKFLPKQLFSIVVEGSRVDAAIEAIIKANRTGKGEYGDGKIFILDVEEAIRVTTDERGERAL
jgi:nitrogen regulatory protein P-II 1